MKKAVFLVMIFLCSVVMAKPIKSWLIPVMPEAKTKIPVYQVVKVIDLAKSNYRDLTVRLLIVDHGLSTDYSPRYQILLSYFHATEETHCFAVFNLGFIQTLDRAERLKAGIYQITIIPFDPSDPNNREKKVMVIDTRSVFLADQRLKQASMQDSYLKAPIKIQGVLLYRGWDSQSNQLYKLKK